jgi:hypothetical protein
VTDVDFQPAVAEEQAFDYIVYGLRLRSRIRLTIDDAPVEGTADLWLAPGDPDWFESAVSQVKLDEDWINIHELTGGWSYVRYDGMFDFLISPAGDRIFYRLIGDLPLESFQTYALGRIFSFALVKKGHEPLHAATVVVNGKGVAFMGASTFGKSSLAACFIDSGFPLLTDDVLRLEENGDCFLAFPGPPRLKLLPLAARIYIGDVASGVPINNRTPKAPKRVYSLPAEQCCPEPVPLGAIYVITGPRKVHRKQQLSINAMQPVEALVKVLTFTHNHELRGPDRLARQFDAARRLIGKVPVRSLSYPRIMSSLPEVKTAILADLSNYVDTF